MQHLDENGFGVEGISAESREMLKQDDWPGNIRELENAIERAVVLTRSGIVKKEMFSLSRRRGTLKDNRFVFMPGSTIARAEKELIMRTLEQCNQNRTKAAQLLDISIRTLRNKLNEYGMAKDHDAR